MLLIFLVLPCNVFSETLSVSKISKEDKVFDSKTGEQTKALPKVISQIKYEILPCDEDGKKKIDSALLLAWLIQTSDDKEVEKLGEIVGIKNPSKENLLSHFKLDYSISDLENDFASGKSDDGFKFEISKADILKKSGNGGNYIRLDGNVNLKLNGVNGEQELISDRIDIDSSNKTLVSSGNISIKDASLNKSMKDITASGLIIDMNNSDLKLMDAIGAINSTENSSGGTSYFFKSDNLLYNNKNGNMVLKGIKLSTSDQRKTKPIWTINANNIVTKGTGDVFFSWTLLRMGSVPVLPPIPFWIPGSALVINPSFGLHSVNGAFVNTSFYIYGNPQKQKTGSSNSLSSFSSLFASGGNEGAERDGLLYKKSDKKLQGLQKWANETSSYFAINADVSSSYGPFIGVDTVNNNIGGVVEKINFTGGVSYLKRTKPTVYNYDTLPDLRYIGGLDTKLSYKTMNLTLNMPFQSDPMAHYYYLNHLNGLGISQIFSVFGASVDLPHGNETSNNSDYRWTLDFNWIPNLKSNSILSNFNTALKSEVKWSWSQKRNGSYEYKIQEAKLPNVTISMSGTIFSVNHNSSSHTTSKKDSIIKEKDDLDLLVEELKRKMNPEPPKRIETLDYDIFDDSLYDMYLSQELISENEPLLALEKDEDKIKKYGLYSSGNNSNKNESNEKVSVVNARMTYSIKEELNNDYEKDVNNENKLLGANKSYSKTSASFTLTGGVWNDKALTFSFGFNPYYIWNREKSSTEDTIKHEVNLSGKNTVNIPYLTLSYSLDLTYMTYSKRIMLSNVTEDTKKTIGWNTDFVTRHSLSISNILLPLNSLLSLPLSSYGLSLGLSAALPPIKPYLTPSFSFSKFGLTVTASHTWKGEDYKDLKSDVSNFSVNYNNSNSILTFNFNLNGSCDWSKIDPNRQLSPIKINLTSFKIADKNNYFSINQTLEYEGLTSDSRYNYFKSINTSASFYKDFLTLGVNFYGSANNLKFNNSSITLTTGRKYLGMFGGKFFIYTDIGTTFIIDFFDAYQNSFKINATLGVTLRDFLEMEIKLGSSNSTFYRYLDKNGKFVFGDMVKDLARSFDIFGNGRFNTAFVLETTEIKITHKMSDWDLVFNYKGEVVQNKNEWKWTPQISVLLSWKAIPELKIDKTIKE